jgi:hypothetical protein
MKRNFDLPESPKEKEKNKEERNHGTTVEN